MSYAPPTMAEIAAARGKSGLTAISLFSGIGGSCLGFELAGFDVRFASEFVSEAAAAYRLNHPGVPVDERDVRDLRGADVLDAARLSEGEVDVLEGSPPCASFSTSGRGVKGWGKVRSYSTRTQRVDDLFDEYVRLVGEIRPRVFVAENVPGFGRGAALGTAKRLVASLRDLGYRVEGRILDAQWLGVPQVRKRLFFVGTREDLRLRPPFPAPSAGRVVLREALALVAGSPIEPEAWITRYAIGREWRRMKLGQISRRYLNLVRTDPSRPCYTITQLAGVTSAASAVHPYECRKFSIAELLAISSFPLDLRLLGDYRERVERIGRAVPPLMSYALARSIATALDRAEAA